MTGFDDKTLADWAALAAKERKGERVETLTWQTAEGIAVKPLYTAADLEELEHLGTLPGFPPFTRGPRATMYAGRPWTIRQYAGYSTAEESNAFYRRNLAAGQQGLSVAFDLATHRGYDSDHPRVTGDVGKAGVAIDSVEDMKLLFSEIPLDQVTVSMTMNGAVLPILACFIAAGEEQGVAREKLAGTIQNDILKEFMVRNTYIYPPTPSMRIVADIIGYTAEHMPRFNSISISGYHIAEAGANPITQLAFTLANGFTFIETYLARGMDIDDFAPNLSFFFSNGMDPEYTVIGRVARRIWARAMRERYGASSRSQMLKYHVQTSGRSLHAQEISFNDIRTTLQALYAMFDNCNSLHTNAFDEAVTTPTEQSVRRAVAIQMIISRELGLNFCENPWQGSFIINELTDLVEEAVYVEFERISERGGVLGAMDTMYQRGKIQDESLYYESMKHDGTLPLIGVNTFLPKQGQEDEVHDLELIRSSDDEKNDQIRHVRTFQETHSDEAADALSRLQVTARARDNIFAELMQTVRSNSLGQISSALYQVGGEYRRNM